MPPKFGTRWEVQIKQPDKTTIGWLKRYKLKSSAQAYVGNVTSKHAFDVQPDTWYANGLGTQFRITQVPVVDVELK